MNQHFKAIARTYGYMVDIKVYIFILAFVLNISIKKERKIFLASIRYLMNIQSQSQSH